MPSTPVDLVLTDIGYRKMLGRDKTGPHLVVANFAVAEYAVDYTPTSSATDLLGTTLHKGEIETSLANDQWARTYRCVVPETSTPGTIYEVGLYLDSGELFAIGVLPTRYTKTSRFRLLINARLKRPNVNKSVEFAAIDNPTTSVVQDYCNLPQPNITGPNAWFVINGHCALGRFSQQAPTMVCKWKNGDEWAVVNGSIVYRGPVAAADEQEGNWIVIGAGSIVHDEPERADVAMLMVTDGAGKYQCRRVLYEQDSGRYVILDKPLQVGLNVNGDTQVTIWAGPGCCGGACV